MSSDKHRRAKGNVDYLGEYYEGSAVADYDRKRENHSVWLAEQDALTHFMHKASRAAGSVVLDVPVGTGRFLDTYARLGYRVIGIDISPDMVEAARRRGAALNLHDAAFETGDATRLALPDKSADLVVSVRFLNHLELAVVRLVVAELARVSRRFLVLHLRVARPTTDRSGLAAVAGAIRNLPGLLASLAFKRKKVADKAATIHAEAAIHEIFTGAGSGSSSNWSSGSGPRRALTPACTCWPSSREAISRCRNSRR